MPRQRLTITALATEIPNEAAAYQFLEALRWQGQPVCPHCGSINDHYFLKPTQGLKMADKSPARQTRTGAKSPRRLWKCKDCRQPFSVTTGTVMHGSKVPIRIWLFVIFEMCANKNGIAAREIERKYGVASRTAWFMTHRLREAMDAHQGPPFHGVVIADEAWIGGEPKNRHAKDRKGSKQGRTRKTPIVSLISEATGEVRSVAVANVNGRTLRTVIAENVELAWTTLYTDSASAYKQGVVGKPGREAWVKRHETVNHQRGEYVRNGVSTNMAENFFSQLKRSIDGTHHHVSREHLNRYLAEFDFRHSTHKMSDTARVDLLGGMLGTKRVTYKRIAVGS